MDRQRLNDEYLNVDEQIQYLREQHRTLQSGYGAYLKTEQRHIDLEQFDLQFARKIEPLEERLSQLRVMGATATSEARQVGLSRRRIDRFNQFPANDSMSGEKCICCHDDLDVGRMVVRLDCTHDMCHICTLQWFSDHNTCPLCRKVYY